MEETPVRTVPEGHIPGAKLVPPEGMTKSQYKKQLKRARWASERGEMRKRKREKLKQKNAERRAQIAILAEKGESYAHLLKRRPNEVKRNAEGKQDECNFGILVDCGYDDMMINKEVVSLSNQITRSYSNNRIGVSRAQLLVSGLDKRLKERFETRIKDYVHWKPEWVQFTEQGVEESLKNWKWDTELGGEEKIHDYSNVVYLSADTDEMITELEPNNVYVIGGIVDKGRHKNLCKGTAEKLGIRTARLPIDEFINLTGRKVLTTSHVIELLLKWHEFKDWKKAFETVLPPRKLEGGADDDDDDDNEDNDDEENEELPQDDKE